MASAVNPRASVMLSNSVASEVGTNNLILIGLFDNVQSAVFPAKATFYATAKVWGLPPGQEAVCQLRLVDSENGQVIAQAGEHRFTPVEQYRPHTAISLFQGVAIPRSGVYEVQAFVGNEVAGSFPLAASSAKG